LHAHVLPAVDDGPENVEEAVEIISSLVSGGTEVIVATPHSMPGRFEASLDDIRQAAAALQDALAAAEVPVRLVLGQEITYRQQLLPALERGELLTINETAYFLFEFPPYYVPPDVRDFVFEARLQRYFPILAHPERNEPLQGNPDLLERLVEGGALVQLTASSLFGRLGPRVQRSSHLMLQRGLAHFIATDCHSFRFGPGDMSKAVEVAAVIVGREAAADMVGANPLAVIEGRPLML